MPRVCQTLSTSVSMTPGSPRVDPVVGFDPGVGSPRIDPGVDPRVDFISNAIFL